ncbi:DNA repair protein RecO [Roseivivax halodurans JCM 10272]|uniref:DNA repair protein RecO n=1 Tax=Roseivivax halodurans JCM 10272 TaxID=1449350 RepID=X7EIJ8_9RHOB|nr:DNA repair protein RecO [Roseivivax halodurans]ETX15747.1 DNA repair protein RecO [Roseivivax halodurans JCM 10272]
MDWRDTGILLTVRRHGETSAILEVFTETRGRHAGVLRGASSRKAASILQPGSELDVTWRARLEDHIGTFTAEPRRSRSAQAMADPLSLAGLNAVTALLAFTLPEREAHPGLYRASGLLLDALAMPRDFPFYYLRWEMMLLEEMGFGLDLTRCAVTGATDGLRYVSPRTGRAVTVEGAGAWADRLLPLPPALFGEGNRGDDEILTALGTTGHFLETRLSPALGDRRLPAARALFVERLRRRATRHDPEADPRAPGPR